MTKLRPYRTRIMVVAALTLVAAGTGIWAAEVTQSRFTQDQLNGTFSQLGTSGWVWSSTTVTDSAGSPSPTIDSWGQVQVSSPLCSGWGQNWSSTEKFVDVNANATRATADFTLTSSWGLATPVHVNATGSSSNPRGGPSVSNARWVSPDGSITQHQHLTADQNVADDGLLNVTAGGNPCVTDLPLTSGTLYDAKGHTILNVK